MANLDKSIELADSLLANIPDEVFERMWHEVKTLGIGGPTYDEYLANFESEYDNLFNLCPNAGFNPVILPAFNFTRSKPVDDESPDNPVQP